MWDVKEEFVIVLGCIVLIIGIKCFKNMLYCKFFLKKIFFLGVLG